MESRGESEGGRDEGRNQVPEFDSKIPRPAEGSFFNPGLESMPRSSPPTSRRGRKLKAETMPGAMYRVSQPASPPPPPSLFPPPSLLPPSSLPPPPLPPSLRGAPVEPHLLATVAAVGIPPTSLQGIYTSFKSVEPLSKDTPQTRTHLYQGHRSVFQDQFLHHIVSVIPR
ncbi:hypothetical protein GBAR_LOCUS15274 [Geodia barretti]|uniref:Uncharacterized protein n=1 Tax=Geodia barretti TaxID=519541 RepID=A0AA35SAU0_GEOBA|nr:hypothetical protein GBAR_LOCUS15274 [Geodia barretti]